MEGCTGLRWVLDSPPEPFEDEFPMVGEYVLFADPTREGLISMFIPEDDEYVQDPHDILERIYRMAPLAEFAGAVGVNIEATEE